MTMQAATRHERDVGVAPSTASRQVVAVHRHPGDLVRIIAGTGLLVGSAAVASAGTVGTLERDLFQLVNNLPNAFETPLTVVMQVGALASVPASAAVALAARRPRLARDLAVAGAAAWVLARVVKNIVGRARPGELLSDLVLRHNVTGLGYPSGHVAVAAALATAAGPYLPRPARRLTWFVVGVVAVARMYVGAHLPVDVVGGAALGWAIGAALHLTFGAPANTVTAARVAAALEKAGLHPATVMPSAVDARGSVPFQAVTKTGQRLFVKAMDREHRDADMLFKLWRYVRLRNVEDEAPFVTPKQQVEHEALLLLLAARSGARVPTAVAALQVGSRPALLVQEEIDGTSLDRLAPGEITDGLLRATWHQVGHLQRARIADRDLRLANIVRDRCGNPSIVDFGFAELSASDHRLAQDVAELLASTTALVGPAWAVDAAVDGLGLPPVVDAVPLLQAPALSVATSSQLRRRRGALEELRSEVAGRSGREPPELERLTRLRPVAVLWLLFALVGVHLLLPQVGELSQTWAAVRRASVPWLFAAIALSAGTYLAAAVARLGTVEPALDLGRTVEVEVATTFVNRVTVANVGGLGVGIRYLQRAGLSRTDAVSAAAANTLAGALVHVAMLLAFGIVVGRSDFRRPQLPDGWLVLVAVVAVFTVAGIALGTTSLRRRLLGPVRSAATTLLRVIKRRRRAVELFGGSFALTSLYIAALVCALQAFGGGTGWEQVAVVYLGGSAVATAAPTPGGLGAFEAALVAGLTAFGAAAAPAIAGVLAFRLATFWLPIAPGWVAFHVLSKRQVI